VQGCEICGDAAGFVSVRVAPYQYRLIPCTCALGQEEQRKIMARLVKRSRLPRTYPETDPTRGQYAAWYRTREYSAQLPSPARPWLVYSGPFGVGKTRYALNAAHAWLAQTGEPCLFLLTQTLIRICEDNIGRSYRRETPSPEYQEAFSTPLLILDDLGAEKHTPAALDKMTGLLAERFSERKPTIITSNAPIGEIPERIQSRLIDMETCTLVNIVSEDYRGRPDLLDATRLMTPLLGTWDSSLTPYNGPDGDVVICHFCQSRPCVPSCPQQLHPEVWS
jgi:DNA replication protein DnaC